MSYAKYSTDSSYFLFHWLTVWDHSYFESISKWNCLWYLDISNNHRYITNWVFLNGAWIPQFIGPSQDDHKIFLLLILIWIPPHKMDLIALHCISRYKFLIIQSIFLGRNRGYLDRGREWGNPIWPNRSAKSHYMSIQDGFLSPRPRKGTFGTPIGIKWKKKRIKYSSSLWCGSVIMGFVS